MKKVYTVIVYTDLMDMELSAGDFYLKSFYDKEKARQCFKETVQKTKEMIDEAYSLETFERFERENRFSAYQNYTDNHVIVELIEVKVQH